MTICRILLVNTCSLSAAKTDETSLLASEAGAEAKLEAALDLSEDAQLSTDEATGDVVLKNYKKNVTSNEMAFLIRFFQQRILFC